MPIGSVPEIICISPLITDIQMDRRTNTTKCIICFCYLFCVRVPFADHPRGSLVKQEFTPRLDINICYDGVLRWSLRVFPDCQDSF